MNHLGFWPLGACASIGTGSAPRSTPARKLLSDPNEDAREEASTGSDADDALRRFIGTDTVPKEAVMAAMRAEGYTPKMVRNAFQRTGVKWKRAGFGADMKTYWSLPHGTELPQDESPVVPSHAHKNRGHEWARLRKRGHE